ncbi:glycosyltransferase [Arthrobacter psychrolactophilus]
MLSNSSPVLALVVVNYGSHQLLEKNIVPISQRSPDIIVVIVDNYSNEAERFAVESLTARNEWVMVAPNENVGFGAGMNLGVDASIEYGASNFLLLNPDASIDSKSVDELLDTVGRMPMTMVGPKILSPDGSVWFDGSDVYLAAGETHSASKRDQNTGRRRPWLTGACLMISKELWAATGGFDESYFLYWEDVDLSFRVVKAGGDLMVMQSAIAIHDEGGTHSGARSMSRAKSPMYYYYNIRNRLLFAALNLSADDNRRWRRSSIGAGYKIVLRGGRRQFLRRADGFKILWAALRGTWDGLQMARSVAAAKSR